MHIARTKTNRGSHTTELVLTACSRGLLILHRRSESSFDFDEDRWDRPRSWRVKKQPNSSAMSQSGTVYGRYFGCLREHCRGSTLTARDARRRNLQRDESGGNPPTHRARRSCITWERVPDTIDPVVVTALAMLANGSLSNQELAPPVL
jgi:hypothetical protein